MERVRVNTRPSPIDLIRKKPLAAKLGVNPWTLDRWRKAGQFPQPIWLSPSVPAWRVSDIDAWLRTKQAA
jgi:predicted DNA-binding transcriptional regulator AlpA